VIEMKFSGISRAQLVRELKEERDVLSRCVANCLPIVRAHFAAELGDVVAFIEYLSAVPESARRCPHYRAIRRTFAIAKDRGLDVKDESAMRRAIGRALGRTIESRDELGASDWQTVGDLMKRGALAW